MYLVAGAGGAEEGKVATRVVLLIGSPGDAVAHAPAGIRRAAGQLHGGGAGDGRQAKDEGDVGQADEGAGREAILYTVTAMWEAEGVHLLCVESVNTHQIIA